MCLHRLVWLALSLLATAITAAGQDSGVELQPPAAVPTVTVVSAPFEVATDELRVRFAVYNPGDDTVVVVPELEVPRTIVAGSRTNNTTIEEGVAIVRGPSFDLEGRERLEKELALEALGVSESIQLLFLRNRPADIRIRINYQRNPGETEHEHPTAVRAVSPQGPLVGVIVGSVLGVTAAIVFVVILGLTHGVRPSGEAIVLRWLLGVVTVSISAAILRYSSVQLPQLPISINVKDYIGGFLLGLVFHPLVGWLSRLILGGASQDGKTSPRSA